MFRIGSHYLKIQNPNRFWFAAPITLSGKCNVFFVLSGIILLCYFYSPPAQSREAFEFNLGEKINILSDKAFRKSSENEFEAVGNVVITHLKNSIYGEKARINFITGDTEVMGNVRYIAPEMTLYGSKLKYNFLTKRIDLDNARILSDNYVVTGKKITQTSADIIYAEDAEYTTCKDCPESWSIFGKKITITVGKYVRLQHAFLKIKGVVAMYIPYIIFPIKQRRESGVLFPVIGFNSKEGFKYQQPFFLVIDDYKDLTLTPSTFGNRGLGGELQYRQNIKEKTWVELNSIQLNDKIYAPNKLDKNPTGGKVYRHFSDIETHYIYKHFLNGHIYLNNASDLDTIRDFDFFSKKKIGGTEIGVGGFLEGRSSLFSLGVQSFYNQNMLVIDPRKFDDQYVQVLPKITLSTVPYNVIYTEYPFLKNVSVGLNSDYTIFKQNKVELAGPIRNAERLNLAPYAQVKIGNLGPVFFSHLAKLDYQSYNLPTENDKKFFKKVVVYETEAKFELEKRYGLSYVDQKPIISDENKNIGNGKNNGDESLTIGSLPPLQLNKDVQTTLEYHHSYRHSQEVKFKHYYLSEQQFKGNSKFREQIENSEGQFDYLDAPRNREHLSNQTTSYDSLPLKNTLEVQWNNNLIQKEAKQFDPYLDGRYLKDNFSYSNIAYFDVSQGLDLTVRSDHFVDRLTRLFMTTGFSLKKLSFSLQEFYSHKFKEHKTSTAASYSHTRGSIAGRFTYNSFNSTYTPITKLMGYDLAFNLNDLITLKNSLDYNIETKMTSRSSYSFLYSPLNNCWKIEFNYVRDLIDKKFGILFYINYNNNNFTSINVR